MNAALEILYILVAVNLLLAILLYGIKIRNVRTLKAQEHFQRKFKDYLIYIQANMDGEGTLRVPPMQMKRIERSMLQDKVNDMIEAFTGDQRDKLIDLCEQLGFIQHHLKRLQSRSYRRRIDATYHLGCMRVGAAVPAMLEQLRHHKLESSLFVIARAIAKSARNEQDVKDMVRILLTKGKSFPDLIADMIGEAAIDHTALFTEFIHSSQPELIRIGMAGMKEYTAPVIAASVYQLMDSSNEEIQRQAIEMYLKSSAFFPANMTQKLLGHPYNEVRLLTVQALSEHKNMVYADALKRSLQDSNPRVVYASAMGLIQLGEKGMSIFCETARDSRDAGQGTHLQDLIEEVLRSLSASEYTLDNVAQYNALLYTYEKTFGKNKRIYRVV